MFMYIIDLKEILNLIKTIVFHLTIFNNLPVYESNFSNFKLFVATNRYRFDINRANKADSDIIIVRWSFVTYAECFKSIHDTWFKVFVSIIVTINSVGPIKTVYLSSELIDSGIGPFSVGIKACEISLHNL